MSNEQSPEEHYQSILDTKDALDQQHSDLKAISLSWYGYFTTKPLPPNAYIIWQKLSNESKSTFRRLAEKNLGA